MKQYRVREILCSIVFGAVLLLVIGGRPAPAGAAQLIQMPDKAKIEAARAFFKGKSIEIIVPYVPGGTYDGKVRLMQRFLENNLPGVKVLVKNLPGAGGVQAMNQVYVAKPNGLTIAIFNGTGMAANQIGGSDVIKYDATKFTYLGRVSSHRFVFVAGLNNRVKDLDSLLKSPVPVREAITGVGSGVYAVGQIIMKVLGFPHEMVVGYQGGSTALLSVVKGETDAHLAGSDGAADLLARKEIRAIFQLGPAPLEGLEKVPNLLAKKDLEKLKLSEENLKRVQFAGDLMTLGFLIVGPPKIPPERAWVLENAVQKTLSNPEFIALGKKTRISANVDPLAGKDITALVVKILNVSPDLKAEMTELMKAQ